ncbi:MAG TPA: flavodoxin family protein [Desulfocapsa sulfexigens]|nr:flavodoxin family protein [Desulfocapsa sulfexigens]
MKVIGVSGSPIKNSNTDRALKIALAATGVKTEFVKLSKLNIEPCTACLGCKTTNRCILKDDGILLTEKVYKADALIVAGFTPYSSIDSRTKIFLERLYPLHHLHALMSGKPGGAIVTSAIPQGIPGMPDAYETGLSAIRNYMLEEGMNFIGSVSVPDNLPCVSCGEDGQCGASAIKMIYGSDATPNSIGINSAEDSPEVVAALKQLGQDIIEACFN